MFGIKKLLSVFLLFLSKIYNMRKISLTLCFLLVSLITFAGKLVLIPVTDTNNLESLFNNKELKIHYYCDDYVLATTSVVYDNNAIVLDENAFADVSSYAIVYCYENDKEEYIATVSKNNSVLYSGNNFLVMKILSNDFMPAKNDGMVAVRDIEARLPKPTAAYPVVTEPNEDVLNYLSQVSVDTLMTYIQSLQDFETRRCDHSNSILAQDWIKEQYENLGLDVFIHEIPTVHPWWGGTAQSGNVIAIQYGTEFPDEYIVCGAHYDSFAFSSPDGEPGADDNASGIAGIIETARILSQYDFKRSIIYCAFTAEECGLYGSGYYAEQCANQDMNIVGYFNLDMIGYLKPNNDMQISLIYPSYATQLGAYFTNVSEIYFPEVPIKTYLSLYGGDSDHTSFNNMGYRGVWPFEDNNNHSPYIHTPNDTIGLSVNNPDQVEMFTQVHLACIATLALYDQQMPPLPLAPPTNCLAETYQVRWIVVNWDAPTDNTPTKYYVYRDNVKLTEVPTTQLSYIYKPPLGDYSEHCYKITATYGFRESEFSNESCAKLNSISEMSSKFKIYPNPTTGELYVTSDERQVTNVEIFDVYGRQVYSLPHTPYPAPNTPHLLPITSINLSHLPAGIYFIKIANEFVGKFIKE